ncbi:MAG: uroporphyrinogen decarboxylase family protein [Planctomycetaceae bacterium]|nr:hypothetical protein [Planctomycetaceae bacterium]
MTRRQRLMATLTGQAVDRPPVSFYEIGGWRLDCDNPDPYNIYNGPGWRELIDLAEQQTDIIRMTGPREHPTGDNPRDEFFTTENWTEGASQFGRTTLRIAGRQMHSTWRRDRDVNTTWTPEHLLKDLDDIKAYLQLPAEVFAPGRIDVGNLLDAEKTLGEAGIIMVDHGDPICGVAPLFSMEDYTVLALTEPALFHKLMEQAAPSCYSRVEQIAKAFPGHLWRVVGSEYLSEPFVPPRLYREFLYNYTKPMCDIIRKHGGWPRIHSHGRLRGILGMIAEMADGLDPCEPPPQGDMTLSEIRLAAPEMILFGNIEASDIENLAPGLFEDKVRRAIEQGPDKNGSRFVLHPSACPYGREITRRTMTNYQTMVRVVDSLTG